MQSNYYGIPLTIKGGPGHGSKGCQEKKEEGKEEHQHSSSQESSREANLGLRERRVETYKIYIL
jgi:hypothetical protein